MQDRKRASWRDMDCGGMCLAALVAWSVTAAAVAQPLACRQPPAGNKLALVELYTSEGCDSCPPADHFLSALPAEGEALPIAWHVDYFDALGWKDRFALPAAARRQVSLLQGRRERVVVTPQFFVDGEPLREWRDGRAFRSRVLRSVGRAGATRLTLAGAELRDEALSLAIQVDGLEGPAALGVVRVESGLRSVVTAGENAGRTLEHDHVVRDFIGPVPLGPAHERFQARFALPAGASAAGRTLRVVAWVQDASGHILDATWADCRA